MTSRAAVLVTSNLRLCHSIISEFGSDRHGGQKSRSEVAKLEVLAYRQNNFYILLTSSHGANQHGQAILFILIDVEYST
jgi:hypothetical protein